MKKRIFAVVSAVTLMLSVPLPVSAEDSINLSDFTSSYAALLEAEKQHGSVIFSGNQVLVTFGVMVQQENDVITIDEMKWEVYSASDCQYSSDTLIKMPMMNSDGKVDYNSAHSYCLITAESQGRIIVKGTETTPFGESSYYWNFNVNSDGNFEETYTNDEPVKGDINADGSFNISDVVLLRKWLLAVPDTHLANWKAADFCEDDKLNGFDLCLMKRALIEQRQQKQITNDDIIALSKKGYDLTVADFAPFKGEDVGSGLYIMKYEVADREDKFYLLVGHDGSSDKPIYAKIVSLDTDESIDIRSDDFQKAVEMYEVWEGGKDSEENRVSARTLGNYALEKLKGGIYAVDTVIDSENADELMDEEMAALMDKYVFTSMEFMDEHTVMLHLNYGLFDTRGYLITDDTVTFKPDTQVSVPDKFYDGDVINIEWADGNLYYFTAGL